MFIGQTKTRWTADEIQAFSTAFKKQLSKGIYANSEEMKVAMKQYPCLSKRGPIKLRVRFSNIFSQCKRQV